MKRFLIFSLAILAGTVSYSQNTLKFKVNGVKDTTIFLASYYGNKLYYSDTAKADANGEFTFSKKKNFDPGIYAVVVSGKYFEVVLNNEDVYMESDKADLPGKVVVKKSNENKVFYEYIYYINNKRKEAEPIRDQVKKLDKKDDEHKKLSEKLAAIDKDVKQYQRDLVKNNPKLLIAKVIRMSFDPEIPEAPKGPDGKPLDSLFAYKYMHEHYWDNIDFNDERLVRAPFFHNRIENYFKNMILQSPDTCFNEAKRLIDKIRATYTPDAKGNEVHDTIRKHEMFKYTVHLLTYTFEQSKIMCMDAAFVYMVNTYHRAGRTWWIKKSDLKKYTDRADDLLPILCKTLAHPLSLPDSTGSNWKRLYDMKADYTILVFWDPECGHCKKEMPGLAEVHKKLKSEGKSVEVYAVSSDHNDKWKKFIEENHMEEFTNVAVPQVYFEKQELARDAIMNGHTDLKSLNYRQTFDIFSTPKVFLLDNHKKIVAKQLEAEQIEDLINAMIQDKMREEKNDK